MLHFIWDKTGQFKMSQASGLLWKYVHDDKISVS